jgi:hypothetical protein
LSIIVIGVTCPGAGPGHVLPAAGRPAAGALGPAGAARPPAGADADGACWGLGRVA